MGKPISSDLRERILRGWKLANRAAPWRLASRLRPRRRCASRRVTRRPDRSRRQGRPKGSGKLGPYREVIIGKVKAKPDITMPDLAIWLEAEHGVSVDPSNLSKFLCRQGFTYKKTAAGLGARTQ